MRLANYLVLTVMAIRSTVLIVIERVHSQSSLTITVSRNARPACTMMAKSASFAPVHVPRARAVPIFARVVMVHLAGDISFRTNALTSALRTHHLINKTKLTCFVSNAPTQNVNSATMRTQWFATAVSNLSMSSIITVSIHVQRDYISTQMTRLVSFGPYMIWVFCPSLSSS